MYAWLYSNSISRKKEIKQIHVALNVDPSGTAHSAAIHSTSQPLGITTLQIPKMILHDVARVVLPTPQNLAGS